MYSKLTVAVLTVLFAFAAALPPLAAHGQTTYPTKNIRVLVPSPIGGPSDITLLMKQIAYGLSDMTEVLYKGSTPEEFGQLLQSEIARCWRKSRNPARVGFQTGRRLTSSAHNLKCRTSSIPPPWNIKNHNTAAKPDDKRNFPGRCRVRSTPRAKSGIRCAAAVIHHASAIEPQNQPATSAKSLASRYPSAQAALPSIMNAAAMAAYQKPTRFES